MPRLSLALLGPPVIALDGEPVSLDRQKAVALLAYLALTGRRHGREALAALLWPDLAPERAYAALRQALWALNSALGAGWVESSRTGVALVPGAPLELDVAAFRAHLAAAQGGDGLDQLRAACALYRGDLLAGLDLRDSAPFAEWRFFEAEALRREQAGALDAMADGLAAQGAYDEAAAAARRRLALDPLHEPAHRSLMRLYAAAGQRSAALRQYDECARILAAELAADPDPETRALYEAIRGGRPGEAAGPSVASSVQQGQATPRVPAQTSPPPLTRHPLSAAERGPGGEVEAPGERSELHLPAPATPFVGREAELAQIDRLLRDPACRLLTLLGPGGIGKTRLAIEAVRRAAPRFPDGVCFVPLAPVLDPDLILSAVADALGLDLFRREKVRDLLVDYLRPRSLLLVVDNLEHLIAGADRIGELLEAAPGLKLIATSRERLSLPGEWGLDVGGLSLPEGPGGPAATREAAAVQLFIQGVRRATGGGEPDDVDLEMVARICRLVGGTPLAIELAATWSRLMPYAEIAASIARDLDFLAGSARGMPERHRGPRAVFEHSWRLLTLSDQAAFRRLAVFCGGFTREAAAAVLGLPSGSAGSYATLASLADRSLVRAVGAGRYDLHELLRQYAGERLADVPDEAAAARAAHSAYFLGLLSRSEADLKGARQPTALAALDADLDNVRAAWRHAIRTASWDGLAAALESLFLFYEIESLHEEGEDAFGRAAAAVAAVAVPSRQIEMLLANLLARQAWFALRLYRFEPAWALFQWSIELIERLGPCRETLVAEMLANNPTATGGRLLSEARLQEQIARVRATGDAWLIALALNSYAFTLPTRVAGQAVLEEALAVCRAAGDQRGIANNLDTLASVTREGAQLGKAVAYWEEALAIYRELGYRWAYAYSLDQMAYAHRQMGNLDLAEQLHRESLEGSRAIGDRLGVAGSLDNLALVALERGDLGSAERLAREGLAIREVVGHTLSTRISQLSLAKIAAARGDHEATRALLDACQTEIPTDQEWLHCRAIQLRARLAMSEGDLEATLLLLHTALDLVADNWRLFDQLVILGELAEAYLAAGNLPLAAELAATALAHGPDNFRLREKAEGVLARTGPPAHLRPVEELLSALRR